MSWVVDDVMTRDVVTVDPGASYEQCVGLVRMHGVGALPVVSQNKVVGIVSLTDLVFKGHRPSARERYEPAKTPTNGGLTAATLMTSRLVTVFPDTPLSAAVREMFQHGVNRLPVVDRERRLVGILSRSDVLRMFLRSDVSIRREVQSTVVGDMPFIGRGNIFANVHDGVVTLDGEVEPGTLTGVLLRLVASVPGVMGVKSHLKVRHRANRVRPAR
jgi:CBS domain-containing protein